jgi:UDP-N-acetylglucosamine--N-acetylmuramyl-(pentapeptide) pyrophosphoryl-undecaprenol N-acetylglucosamine transferase
MSSRPVLIMAGGTGGHIYPGIAVARALSARGVPVVWLGSEQGLENAIVPAAGIALERVSISGVRGKGVAGLMRAPLRILRAIWQARGVVHRIAPRAALALGGFAAGPGGIACWMARRPLIVHEQNRVPGMTNRVLARLARRVLAGFPDAFPIKRYAQWVGNPVRADIAALPAPAARLSGRSGAVQVLVLGGSQGARALNRAMPRVLAELQREHALSVRHQTGRALHDDACAAYAASGVDAQLSPYIDDMAQAYAWADVVVCRAGALTLAELCAAGVGSVLVPYPHAVDDHQTRNAQFVAERGGAVLLHEGDDLAAQLARSLRELIADRSRLLAMAEAARALSTPQAAERIADICLEEARP